MYRMRVLSTSTTTSACSDDTSASSSSATTASECYYSRRTAAPTRYSSPESDIALVSNLSHKSGTKHVLIRARNANIPILLRHHQKKTNILTVRRREAQDDPDYELPQLQGLQRVKKQKTKTPEQLEAEERRMLERKAELEDDPLLDASRMCPNKVWCIPCNKYIQIDSRRQFYATLWYKHRGKRHGDVPLKVSESASLGTFILIGVFSALSSPSKWTSIWIWSLTIRHR